MKRSVDLMSPYYENLFFEKSRSRTHRALISGADPSQKKVRERERKERSCSETNNRSPRLPRFFFLAAGVFFAR